jgi:hypothetical protein
VRKPLEIYLADHHAGSTAGVELARRAARHQHDAATRQTLERIVKDIEEDRKTLETVLAVVGTRPSRLKDGLAWSGEKLGRLKPNGQLRGTSPLGRLNELEALALGITGKRALWESLHQVPTLATSSRVDLDQLVQRANHQLTVLEPLRQQAAANALED